MSRRARRAAALARLTPQEHAALLIVRRRRYGTDEQLARACGLSVDALAAVLNAGLEKVDAFYAEHDAAQARRQGRLQ